MFAIVSHTYIPQNAQTYWASYMIWCDGIWVPWGFVNLVVCDYTWVRACPARPLLGACIERKTVGDLISRSARGDHLRQLRRLQVSKLRCVASCNFAGGSS